MVQSYHEAPPLPGTRLARVSWRPHTERPEVPLTTALIAEPDEAMFSIDPEFPYYLAGLYEWRGGRWVDERNGEPLGAERFWWMLETDLLRALPRSTGE